ncbi:MAG: tetratricopeptide repeat protein, partial [Chloroflexota bacterium]
HRLYGRILSRMALLISQYHTAQSTLAHAQESLAIATQYDDLIEMAIAHEAITHCHIIVDRQLDKAQTHLDHSLSLHTTDGDPFYLARIYHKIGFCHAYLGDLDAMYDYSKKALNVARTAGNVYSIGHALNNMAARDHLRGNYEAALAHTEEALRVFAGFDHTDGLATFACTQAELRLLEGDFEGAAEVAQGALEDAFRIESSGAMAYALAALSLCNSMQGDFGLAYRQTTDALSRLNAYAYPSPLVPLAIAIVSIGIEDTDNAHYYLRSAYDNMQEIQSDAGLTWLLPVMALLTEDMGAAVAYLALARTHKLSPQGWFANWDMLAERENVLKQALSPDTYDAHYERGTTQSLEDTVATFWSA